MKKDFISYLKLNEFYSSVFEDRAKRIILIMFLITLFLPLFAYPAIKYLASLDDIAITDETISDGQLILSVSGSGINYQSCYEYTKSDGIEYPSFYDADSGVICFDYHSTTTNIYIISDSGETIHYILKQ